MAKIVETAGRSHVFTLKDGSTFRLNARQTKKFDMSNKSSDIEEAIKRKIVYITEDVPVTQNNKAK